MDAKRILIAIDDSEASERAIAYVGQMLGGASDIQVCLFHVAAAMPPELLEHGGSEDPAEERRIEAKLDREQAKWEHHTASDVAPMFDRARSVLRAAPIPEQAIETYVATPVSGQDLDRNILQAARDHACGTVVVGRESFSWLRELFEQHLADKLLQGDAKGEIALWLVQ